MRGCISACSIPPTLRSEERKMVHKLALVAVAGLTASAVCLGAGGALEGRGFGDFPIFDHGPRCEAISGLTSRDLDWDGGDHVRLTVPGHATYTPGSDNRLHVSGDPRLVS